MIEKDQRICMTMSVLNCVIKGEVKGGGISGERDLGKGAKQRHGIRCMDVMDRMTMCLYICPPMCPSEICRQPNRHRDSGISAGCDGA